MNCDWVKSNITLYVYDELPDDARFELAQHVARCTECAAELKEVREFRSALAMPVLEPSPNLLASSRMRLQEALETTQQQKGWSRFAFDPAAWLRQIKFSPALAMALLIVGFAGGIAATYRISHPAPVGGELTTGPQTAPTEASIAGIRSITQQPGTNNVTITYDTAVPQRVEGSLNDARIQQLLLFAARNNYNSGVRMDSIDLLTQRPEDARIRESLKVSLRYDSNPGVRLKALEALGPYVKDDVTVRDAVLEALVNDSNSGVRVLAIQLLQPVRADGSVRNTLRQLAAGDQNQYIRRQSRRVLATMPEIN